MAAGTTATNGSEILATDYDITADDTWQDTGLVTPSSLAAGTYLLTADVYAALQTSGDLLTNTEARISARIYHTAGSAQAGHIITPVTVVMVGAGTVPPRAARGSASVTTTLPLTSSSTIKVQALRHKTAGVPSWSVARVISSAFAASAGASALTWVKLA
jgi:hypothetical protein